MMGPKIGFLALTAVFASSVNCLRTFRQGSYLQEDVPEVGIAPLPRFTQSRSKFNLFYFLTNLIFPSQNPPVVMEEFQTGGCPGWYLDATSQNQRIEQDWILKSGWSYRPQEAAIAYNGNSDGKEKTHPFPFFWLPRRTSSMGALIKRNFFCQNTSIQADVNLQGAKQAGILFRVIGERNFWALMLEEGSGVKLYRVKEGEPQEKLHLNEFPVKQNTFYTISLQEWMGDVVINAMEAGAEKPFEARYKMKSDEEVSPKGHQDEQGAVGLMATNGSAVFRNTIMGDVNWAPNTGSPGKLSDKMSEMESEPPLARDRDILWELPEDIKSWCPEGALCAGSPYD